MKWRDLFNQDVAYFIHSWFLIIKSMVDFLKLFVVLKGAVFFMCLMISYFWQKDNFQNQHDWRKKVLTRKGKLSTNSCKRYKDDSLWYLFIFSSRAITMMIKFTYRNAKRTERFGAWNVMKKFSADFNGSRSTLNIHSID